MSDSSETLRPDQDGTDGVRARLAMRKSIVDRNIVQLRPDGSRKLKRDRVAGEEPLEIRLVGPTGDPATVAITMRTPGHDFALAVGFLTTEGILRGIEDVRTVEYCTKGIGQEQLYNIVTVHTGRTVPTGVSRRALVTTASCGICGATSLDDLEASIPQRVASDTFRINGGTLVSLPDRLRSEQALFERTGGLHGVGLFDSVGQMLFVREDIGRHNAVDKVIGEALLASGVTRSTEGQHPNVTELVNTALVVSGRVSFEIVQKAAMAGISLIVAVSAASSLAIEAADRFGITLAGFVRDGGANLYTHAHRVVS